MKYDKRKKYILVIDTETTNTINNDGTLFFKDAQVYDLGYVVIDKKGNVYNTGSFINKDVFYQWDLMKNAYFINKYPQYNQEIAEGARIEKEWRGIKKAIADICKQYNISAICMHNAIFDVTACNATQRYLTKSKYRYFFPYGVEIWDSLKMARSIILKQPTYQSFCEKNGYLTKNGKPRATAEILYRYITLDNNFTEQHTGLEDALIEKEIIAYCFRQKKKMNKVLYPSYKEV